MFRIVVTLFGFGFGFGFVLAFQFCKWSDTPFLKQSCSDTGSTEIAVSALRARFVSQWFLLLCKLYLGPLSLTIQSLFWKT